MVLIIFVVTMDGLMLFVLQIGLKRGFFKCQFSRGQKPLSSSQKIKCNEETLSNKPEEIKENIEKIRMTWVRVPYKSNKYLNFSKKRLGTSTSYQEAVHQQNTVKFVLELLWFK